ncbi:MAG: hypothetical protein NC826_01565 [Candidatus Omnitrophica bacterium]|nr:hypothetical protein [Candidatus Omnitrophota bacterium]
MLYHLEIQSKSIHTSSKRIIIFSLFVLYLLIQGYLVSILRAEFYYRKAKDSLSHIEDLDSTLIVKRASFYSKSLMFFEKAIQFNSLNSRYYFEYTRTLLDVFRNNDLLNIVEFKRKQRGVDFLNYIYYQLNRAIALEPVNAEYHLLLGYFYSLSNNEENVEKAFRRAYLLEPHNINNIFYIIKYFVNKDLIDKAIYYFEKMEFLCKDLNYSCEACKNFKILKEKIP